MAFRETLFSSAVSTTSGRTEGEARGRALNAGFDAYLAKPYPLDKVLGFLMGPCGSAALVGFERSVEGDER